MAEPVLLQKLLMPRLAAAIPEQGYSSLGGVVVDAAAAAGLSTPERLLAAYGFGGEASPFGPDSEYVDVLRFRSHGLMDLSRPVAIRQPWPSYESGFLYGDQPVPVWVLDRTRVPVGAEFWRVSRTGEQRALSVYDGPARGWTGAHGYLPPVHLTGPRASWGGHELPGDFVGETDFELVALGSSAPAGFEQVRPQVWRRLVPLSECEEIFEVRLTCTWRDVPCRILQPAGDQILLLLLSDDPADAERLGAGIVEPGVFEVVAPVGELRDRVGTTRTLDGSAEVH